MDIKQFIEQVPYRASLEEFEKMHFIMLNSKQKLKESEDARDIVFSTWFLFDYIIRRFLINAFKIQDYETEKFNPAYDLLPQSFDSCLKSFETLLEEQREIYVKKIHSKTIIQNGIISFPGSFIGFLERKGERHLHQFLCYLNEYQEEYENEYFEKRDLLGNKPIEIVERHWIEECRNIDSNWFKQVRKLNKARNKAAHVFDNEKIFECFGIKGNNRLELLKRNLEKLINESLYFDTK